MQPFAEVMILKNLKKYFTFEVARDRETDTFGVRGCVWWVEGRIEKSQAKRVYLERSASVQPRMSV